MYRFPKESRLLRRSEFLRVQKGGRLYRLTHFLAMVALGEGDGVRIGFTTSKKVGNAVFRNRVRRLARESARHLLVPLSPRVDVVLIAKRGLPRGLTRSDVDRDLRALIRRARLGMPGRSSSSDG